ncbi:unnamed protein product [Paramecium sonneborni]|uniref:Uncharacterized protein n=1 Tax=Paramecium sonneborni TaxID=65129 RepID=A0A8S1KYJ6_9CILI|nr:unnamed protein product [Paramecium sonneborni]
MDIENYKEDYIRKNNFDQHTPIKSKESQDQQYNKMIQNSPCCMRQIQELIVFWVEIMKKYNQDPDVIMILHQMNEILQTSNQTSSQKLFNFTPKQSNIDDQSFNNSFKQDMFQKMNENIIQVQEEINNQACLSPKTIEHGKIDEIQKELDQNKSKFSGSNNEEIPLNTQSEYIKQSYQFDDQKKKRVLSFKKNQNIQLEEFKKGLTDIKTVVEQRLQREISIFKEDLLSEHSKFSNSYSELQEQINTQQDKILKFQLQIENYKKIIQDQSEELERRQSYQNSEQFIQQLVRFFLNDENEIQNIEDAKTIIMENIMSQKQEVLRLSKQLLMIEQNNKIMLQHHMNENQSLKNKFGAERNLFEVSIINLKNSLDQKERTYQELVQELEQIRLSDQVALNEELVEIGHIQMQQQSQLVYLALKLLQQYINASSFELNVAQILQQQLNQLKLSEDAVKSQIKDSKGLQEDNLQYFKDFNERIKEIVQLLCNIYKKVIEWIINQRRKLEEELC